MESIELEDWLRVASWSVPPASLQSAPPEFSASEIVHAWAQIRASVHQKKSLTSADSGAFVLLNRHCRSLQLADSQAKLLQALLTEVSSTDAALLGFVRRFAILGLLAWIRKSFRRIGNNGNSTAPKQPAPETLASLVQSIRKAMEERPLSDLYTCQVILLLGTISTLQIVSAAVKSDCLTTIAVELEARRDVVARGALAEALAGAGHALAVSSQDHLVPIFRAALLLWTPCPKLPLGAKSVEDQPRLGIELDDRQTSKGQGADVLKNSVMLLHLMDYLGSIFLSKANSQPARSTSGVELMLGALLRVLEIKSSTESSVPCTAIMACVGLLRSLYRWDQSNKKRGISATVDRKWAAILTSLEDVVVNICEQGVIPERGMFLTVPAGGVLPAAAELSIHARNRQLCRCVCVAVSRCRQLPAHPCILRCLLLGIFGDGLYLDALYSVLTAKLVTGVIGTSQQQQEKMVLSSDLGSTLDNFQAHVDSFFFQEMGAVARAMCDQYRLTSWDLRGQTEHLVSEYARNLYAKHRLLVAISLKPPQEGWPQYRQTLDKVHQAAFITVVIFFSLVVGEQVIDKNDGSEADRAALALDSLSCVEYFRHVQLREFSKVIQGSVSQIAGSEAASVSLARLFPAYQDIIQRPGTPDLNLAYSWGQDEVQQARILFYFRVMPLCLIKMPEATFATEVAPSMFLYMHHPSETVTKASHALFAAFLSLGVKSEWSELTVKQEYRKSQKYISGPENKPAMALREQLAVFYTQRALQEFPGVTPFEGLVAGIGAIARQLPPGSPATVYCLNCLVEKAATLYNTDLTSRIVRTAESKHPHSDNQHRNFPAEEIEGAQKLQILLLHLVLLVDLQVLPILLKLMAKLILGLPQRFQTTALAEAFDVVGGTSDYTRKPIIVPWLQSLSFLSFNVQGTLNNTQPLSKEDISTDKTRSVDVSNPKTLESKAIEVTSSEHIAQGTIEDEKEFLQIKEVKPITRIEHSGDAPEESLERDKEMDSNEQARLGDKGLEPRSKL